MFKRMQSMHMQALHCFQTVGPDRNDYRVIIALHNTQLGLALGGCRCLHYAHEQLAFNDAMRLAQGMSYKAALANLPQGGGKAVILLPKGVVPSGSLREFLFSWFGQCVEQLKGQYITAMDVGTQVSDMDVIARQTRHVASASNIGDPAEYTALGVMTGIKAALKFCFIGRDTAIKGKTFAIQGLGHVGWRLATQLLQQGGRIIAADLDEEKCRQGKALGMAIVDSASILQQACDVLVPCALGGIINDDNVEDLRCSIIAGSANNQLAHGDIAQRLYQRDILYAPDYIINAGGLIFASLQYSHALEKESLKKESLDERSLEEALAEKIEQKIAGIDSTLLEVFQQSKWQNHNTNHIANALALTRLQVENTPDRPNKGAIYDAA